MITEISADEYFIDERFAFLVMGCISTACIYYLEDWCRNWFSITNSWETCLSEADTSGINPVLCMFF
ncbi:hypothetical protein SUGI_1081360 [Cryptomeria japonica]|nr:hypothetical protein SUGI_1081360 [Cryptomeria japonica]